MQQLYLLLLLLTVKHMGALKHTHLVFDDMMCLSPTLYEENLKEVVTTISDNTGVIKVRRH